MVVEQIGLEPVGADEAPAMEIITSYKGFDANLSCRGYQFEVGKTYDHVGQVKACEGGFHACEYPLDIFNYYNPATSRFAAVTQSGELSRHTDDTKIASAKITIDLELKIPDLVTRAIDWIVGRCDPATSNHTDKDRSASSATGYQSASNATGDQSASNATGDQSASNATGNQSASNATGYQSASNATGYQSASNATGYQSASNATGNRSASNATGYQSASSVVGEGAVALNTGQYGKAKAALGGAIVICRHNDVGKLTHIFSALVGRDGINPDTFYALDENGRPVVAR